MNDAGNARQQIVDKIKESSNILVTVSTSPSVDALSAALGLTLMLNKLDKHATSVVSGKMPPAITFLDPEKTFEGTVDSLRDFIIALDKEKADHLRYKVDGDMVKIFITPYRTTISEKDLQFNQGDYNVELVLALGVKDREHLDDALDAHGRILHDAAVATIDAGDNTSSLGSIAWREESASSLCEMLVSLSEAIKGDEPALDEQISTALLTGIVAATDRFSNNRTSPKVMTMAAQLMAAGANQQLIAAKLEDANEIQPEKKPAAGQKTKPAKAAAKNPTNPDGTTNLSSDEPRKIDRTKPAEEKPTEEKKPSGGAGDLVISHEKSEGVDYVDSVTKQVSDHGLTSAQAEAENKLSKIAPEPEPVAAPQPASEPAPKPETEAKQPAADLNLSQKAEQKFEEELSAVAPSAPAAADLSEQAPETPQPEVTQSKANKILNHTSSIGASAAPLRDKPEYQASFNSVSAASDGEPPSVDPFEHKAPDIPLAPSGLEFEEQPIKAEPKPADSTLSDLDAMNRAPSETARDAVNEALSSPQPQPEQAPAVGPVDGLPPLPDFSTLPPPPPPLPDAPATSPAPQAGALPPEKLADILSSGEPTSVADAQKNNDPGQFKIPGQ